MINLIGNAIKFTFKGGITINVNLHKLVKAPTMEGNSNNYSNHLEFSIIDTGVGMKEED